MSGARRAIVTGAGGFLGSRATRLLVAEGWSVATVGHGNVPDGVRLATVGDVTAEAVAALADQLGEPISSCTPRGPARSALPPPVPSASTPEPSRRPPQ